MLKKNKGYQKSLLERFLLSLSKLKNNIKETQESVLKSPLIYSHNITIAGEKYIIKTGIVKVSDL